ncbi:MAG: uracil-DNA glycosylase [Hellea sp.]|nr:uracil-DNA glycosylase [Hellea sp.]
MFQEPPRDCDRCPRLREFLLDLREKLPDYYNAPVPSFGDPDPKLLIVGLAPGMHGANRTGRPFTGDWAGDLLYKALDKFGFSIGTYGAEADDGLKLDGAMITNAVRCLPPQNKPVGAEAAACRPFLTDQINGLSSIKAIMTLGKISHDNTVRALELRLKDHPFGHHKVYNIQNDMRIYSSYHCSRYNTNTKRLTEDMFFDVFSAIREYLDA